MKLAVLGLGSMGCTHVRALGEISAAELAGVYTSQESKVPAGEFTAVRHFRDVDSVLADSAIDAVDICLPTYLHDQVAVDALRAGKHVLVEKPMALDLFGVDRMLNAARRYKRILMTAHVLRFEPAYTALREAVQRGQYGGLRFASFRRQRAAPGRGAWWDDCSKSGGGVFDLLIHDADLCLQMFGKPAMVTASGYENTVDGADWVDAQLFYEQGLVTIAGGWLPASAYRFYSECTIMLDGAILEHRAGNAPPQMYSPDGSVSPLPLRDGEGYRDEIAYFVECCRTAQQPKFCPPTESADAVKLMLLILESRKRKGAKLVCHL
jgi:predicted dehydrogenase